MYVKKIHWEGAQVEPAIRSYLLQRLRPENRKTVGKSGFVPSL